MIWYKAKIKKCLLFGNVGVLCFLETPVLRFALLPYYRRIASDYRKPYRIITCDKDINQIYSYRSSEYVLSKINDLKIYKY